MAQQTRSRVRVTRSSTKCLRVAQLAPGRLGGGHGDAEGPHVAFVGDRTAAYRAPTASSVTGATTHDLRSRPQANPPAFIGRRSTGCSQDRRTSSSRPVAAQPSVDGPTHGTEPRADARFGSGPAPESARSWGTSGDTSAVAVPLTRISMAKYPGRLALDAVAPSRTTRWCQEPRVTFTVPASPRLLMSFGL